MNPTHVICYFQIKVKREYKTSSAFNNEKIM